MKSSVQQFHTRRWCKIIEKWWSTTNCIEINNCLRSHVWHEAHLYDKRYAHVPSSKICSVYYNSKQKAGCKPRCHLTYDFALQFVCKIILRIPYHLTLFCLHYNSRICFFSKTYLTLKYMLFLQRLNASNWSKASTQ